MSARPGVPSYLVSSRTTDAGAVEVCITREVVDLDDGRLLDRDEWVLCAISASHVARRLVEILTRLDPDGGKA